MLKRVGLSFAAAFCALAVMPMTAMADDAQTATQKDETVYVYTDASGNVKSSEVSVLLKNDSGYAELRDTTNLDSLEAKDDVEYKGSGDSLVWVADGKNVSYTGSTTADMPVSMRTTYTLDGSEISPDKLAGKSGHVTIKYEFTNNSKSTESVNGSCQNVYTPFTCITAIMLDGKDFKNVTVDNCKIVNDGDDMIVAGYAMPGLKESLGDVAGNVSIPESFSLSADVTDFELKSTMTVVTAGLLNDFDSESLGMEGMGDASALEDAMGQLVDGSDALTKGLDTLATHMREFESGTAGIQEGAQALSENLDALAGDDALGALADGAKGIESGTASIKDGAGALSTNLNDLAGENGLAALAEAEGKIASAIGEVGANVGTMKDGIAQASEGLKQAASSKEAFDNASAIMASHMEALVGEGKLTQEEYTAVVTALGIGSSVSDSVSSVATELDGAASQIGELESAISELKGNASVVATGISEADKAAQALAQGAQELEAGADQLNQAAPKLTEGAQIAEDSASMLASGAKELEAGAGKLNEAAPEMAKGLEEAAEGSKTLTDGMRTFNDEGVSQLVDKIQSSFGGMVDRIDALASASKSYTNFSGITSGTTGSVKFVIETDAITRE